MKIAPFEYHRPGTVDEAVALLTEHGDDAKVLAGGQSLLPLLALRLAAPGHLVDIGRLDDLSQIEIGEDGAVLVGAGVRHAAIESSPLVAERVPLLSAAMPLIGHRAIRSRGTVCGSLAHADPAAELPAVALASDADLLLRDAAGERWVTSAAFFDGYLSTTARDDELVVAVSFPSAPARSGWAVEELSRRHHDFACVGVATRVALDDEGRIAAAAMAFFGAAPTPIRGNAAEAVLIGGMPSDDLFREATAAVAASIDPPADIHASAAFRRHVAGVLTKRSLFAACARASEAA